MKSLYFIRHAKSDWSINHLSDIDRPLNERGYTKDDINLVMSDETRKKHFSGEIN